MRSRSVFGHRGPGGIGRGFTLTEALALLVVTTLALGVVTIFSLSGSWRRHGDTNQMFNLSHLRGIHQGMAIYANSNNGFLPGLGPSGETSADGPATGFSGESTTASARMWVLLNGQFFTGELALNPLDMKQKWTTGAATTANFSYAMLSIADTAADEGRRREWNDNANDRAVVISDRALRAGNDAPAGVPDCDVRSVWTAAPGDWKGILVWGDNHAGFEPSHRGLRTRYFKSTATGDNLFADGDGNPAGATETGTTRGSNAFMIYN